MHKRENNGDVFLFQLVVTPPPSPSRRGRGSSKPSPLAGEGRVRGLLQIMVLTYFNAYGTLKARLQKEQWNTRSK
jgi:hypothetical protein